jgi:hypothetical protein
MVAPSSMQCISHPFLRCDAAIAVQLEVASRCSTPEYAVQCSAATSQPELWLHKHGCWLLLVLLLLLTSGAGAAARSCCAQGAAAAGEAHNSSGGQVRLMAGGAALHRAQTPSTAHSRNSRIDQTCCTQVLPAVFGRPVQVHCSSSEHGSTWMVAPVKFLREDSYMWVQSPSQMV